MSKLIKTLCAIKYSLLLILSLSGCSSLYAQEPAGTIRVRKVQDLQKAEFDNTEYRLVVFDRFGNIRTNEIVAYKLYVKTKKGTEEFTGYSNELTKEMRTFLEKQKVACKIFFTNIVAKDDAGHPVPLPDVIEVWFPVCKNNKKS